jgi:bacteriorhodopsin
MHWRWYIVGGAAFVLLILLVILRRTNKIPEAKTQTKT